MASGKWSNLANVENKCGPEWYGFSGGSAVGTISTILNSSPAYGCGRLVFGNCWDAGVVRAYFDGGFIGEAEADTPTKTIEFPIDKDSLLEIKDEGANSVIKFTSFEMVSCTGNYLNYNFYQLLHFPTSVFLVAGLLASSSNKK